MSPERQKRMLEEQIDDIEEGILEVKRAKGERFTIKQLEHTRKSLKAGLEKFAGQPPQGRCGDL